MQIKSLTPTQVETKIESGENFRLIDVREPAEFALAVIETAELRPMSEFETWLNDLRRDDEIVVMCHHGVRSAAVCRYLLEQGFEKVWNLDGGIDAWSTEVDRRVPRY